MNGIRKFLNKNMNKIIVWAILIIAVIAVIQVLDHFSGVNKEVEKIIDNQITEEKQEEQSIITGQNISNTQREQIQIIEVFFNNINKENFEEAYNILSNECKEELYIDLNTFIKDYVEIVYKGIEINYNIENWAGSTYKVDILNNSIITGIEGENIQDYITITTTEEDEEKININNYIRRIYKGEEEEKDNIKIKIQHVDVYKEYVEYVVKVTNKTNDEIVLAEIGKEAAIYLLDEENIKYYWAMNELSERELLFYPGETRELEIKFYSNYLYNKSIEKIVFNNIFKIIDLEGGADFIEYKIEI